MKHTAESLPLAPPRAVPPAVPKDKVKVVEDSVGRILGESGTHQTAESVPSAKTSRRLLPQETTSGGDVRIPPSDSQRPGTVARPLSLGESAGGVAGGEGAAVTKARP